MSAGKSYAKPVEIGEVMTGGTVGEVIESSNRKFKPGDYVVGSLGWQQYAVSDGEGLTQGRPQARAAVLLPRRASACRARPPGSACSSTASRTPARPWWCRRPPARSAAWSGSSRSCRAAARSASPAARPSATSPCKELGFDACVDYKAGKLYEDLKAACPDGIDCYFENVGGEVMDTVFRLLNAFSRVALCGLIADYNATEPYGVTMMRSLLVNRVNLRGFIVSDRVGSVRARHSTARQARRAGQDQVPRDGGRRAGERAQGVHRHAQGRQPRQAARESGLIGPRWNSQQENSMQLPLASRAALALAGAALAAPSPHRPEMPSFCGPSRAARWPWWRSRETSSA